MTATLVTGLRGFAGSHFADLGAAAGLLLDGQRVDLADASAVRDAVAAIQPAQVVHLAAQSSAVASHQAVEQTYDVNFRGTQNLLEALRACGFRGRMLYVGSAEVYGIVPAGDLPVVEERTLRPCSPYAVSKVAAEALCYQWSRGADFEIVMARPFTHIGPRQSTHLAISDFARQVAACRQGRGPATLAVGDIDTTRDFTDVRDVVGAYRALLASGVNGEAYNVCSGVERRVRDVIEELFDIGGVRMEVKVEPGRMRRSEHRRMVGSNAKLREATGWAPVIPFRQTLSDILDYWEREDSAATSSAPAPG